MAPTKKRENAEARFRRMNQIEEELWDKGFRYIAGVDEAGRGPLAGPVYAAAVILDPEQPIIGLNDSKKLSEKKRLALAEEIKTKAKAWTVYACGPELIDEINILEATKLAMQDALSHLMVQPDFVLLDAVRLSSLKPGHFMSLNKGDSRCNAIAAASILAKTARDAEMVKHDETYPAYGFARHKGYGTKAHYEALDQYGPCPIHRQSFLRSWYERRGLDPQSGAGK